MSSTGVYSMNQRRFLPLAFLLAAAFQTAAAQVQIQSTHSAEHPTSLVRVVAGEIRLPAGRDWIIEEPLPAGLGSAFLVYSDALLDQLSGERMQTIHQEKALRVHRQALQTLWYHTRRHALTHQGVGPADIFDFEAKTVDFLERHGSMEALYLIPDVKIYEDVEERRPSPPRVVAFELAPILDDNEHWVLMNTGRVERRAINPALFTRHSQELTRPTKVEAVKSEFMTIPVLASWHRTGPKDVKVRLRRWGSDERLTATWTLADKLPERKGLIQEWATQRYWNLYGQSEAGSEALILDHWRASLDRSYKLGMSERNRGRNQRFTGAMGVLGGRAAIRETLQLQNIANFQERSDSKELFAIESIPGVQVDAHPFEEMLDGDPGGHLPLADFCPVDRFFIYFGQPKALTAFMDSGAPVLKHTGLNLTGRQLDYDLANRYLDQIGLDETSLRTLLNSGAIAELAVILPDLFFIDGTDISCVVRLANPTLAKAALTLMGIHLKDDAPTLVGRGSRKASWQLLADDILLISTHAKEAAYITASAGTPHCLSSSFEMKFMLQQVPVDETTLMFAYFSDPFIRRLVGPEVKIGQYRRLRARAELEDLSTAALLFETDHGEAATLNQLETLGYLPEASHVLDRTLEADYRGTSALYGTPSQLTSLLDLNLERVTFDEKQAYEAYRENYTRYWRRFFDPIGIRINQESNHQFSAETLILPLLDNSIYNNLRDGLAGAEAKAIAIPQLDPKPVAMTSMNLGEDIWIELIEGVIDDLVSRVGWESALFDQLGPDLHFALADADPIVALGGGDIGGLLGVVDGSSDMLGISALISMFTRPVSLLIGLKDPALVERELQRLPSRTNMNQGFFGMNSSFYRISDTDRYVLELDVEGAFRMRFGMSVEGRYLHITNQPLSHRPKITGTNTSLLGAAQVELNPAACIKQLPALHASAMSRERAAAMSGIDYLYPLVGRFAKSVDGAGDRHRHLFGFRPSHPEGGQWVLTDGILSSDRFGHLAQQQQPDPDTTNFGALQRVNQLQLSMQFEHDGLRSRIEWTVKPRP